MNKKISCFIFIFLNGCLLSGMLYAGKTGVITGLVRDDSTGIEISSATVLIKQASICTYADVNGNFTINNAPEGIDTLTISFIGYWTKRITVNVKAGELININVGLKGQIIGIFDKIIRRRDTTVN